MILLCGITSETPLAMVAAQLEALGAPYVTFNQRAFDGTTMEFSITGGRVGGTVRLPDAVVALQDIQGVYVRLMDDQVLPELAAEPPDSPRRQLCRSLHDTLTRWCEVTPARVVNRTRPMGSNFSKPYQAQLIRQHGFAVPETLVTNDPEAVHAFRAQYGRIIYKSISGIRSIVQTLEEHDLQRLDSIRWCPTQFQAFVDGTNVRVHVVGREIFATAVHSQATDYRYASRQVGTAAELRAVEVPDDVAQRCLDLSEALELPFAGVDLKVTPSGRVFCFEVNPSPAFSYYEANTGQPIARALARYLSGAD